MILGVGGCMTIVEGIGQYPYFVGSCWLLQLCINNREKGLIRIQFFVVAKIPF